MQADFASPSACRWGIVSTARVAHKFARAVRSCDHALLSLVGSRSLLPAAAFAAEHSPPTAGAASTRPEVRACGTYDAVLADPLVDAVYIPAPTAMRCDLVCKALASGKCVLVEKPAGSSAQEVEKMLLLALRSKRFFMDGVMFAHHMRMKTLLAPSLLADKIGEPRHVDVTFSFYSGEDWLLTDIRTKSALEPLGVMGDLGVYVVRFGLMVFEHEDVVTVQSLVIKRSFEGVPTEMTGTVVFTHGKVLTFFISFHTTSISRATINGARGTAEILDFVTPDSPEKAEIRFTTVVRTGTDTKARTTETVVVPTARPQECEMVSFFSNQVLRLATDPDQACWDMNRWMLLCLRTSKLMDALLAAAAASTLVPTLLPISVAGPIARDRRSALLIVDVQYDFLPGGSLAVPAGDEVIQPIVALLEQQQMQMQMQTRVVPEGESSSPAGIGDRGFFDLVVLTQDWHPSTHTSFASNNPGKKPFEVRERDGQVLWPDHCIQQTHGAEVHRDVVAAVRACRTPVEWILKGTDENVESYSAFYDQHQPDRRPTRLHAVLQEHAIERLYVCGLATDYCVRCTIEDALKMPALCGRYEVVFLKTCSRGLAASDLSRSRLTAEESCFLL